jgi:hypothetical protein
VGRRAVRAGGRAGAQTILRMGMGTDGWDPARTLSTDGWDRARTRGADAWNRAQTPRTYVATGTNIGSERGRKANRAQPLRSRHVSRRGRVRHRARA